ncbi:MAG: hypothetical protein CME61_06365, partial [Halobacteriovoraceae bacterium]|nr:hypothetical protein [Halobacteriovoraceae bacterium]
MFSFDELLNIPGMIFVSTVSVFWVYYNFFHISEKNFLNAFGHDKNVNKLFSSTLLIASIFSWALICFAVAKPIKYIGSSENKKDVRDILFVVDVSRSMLAVDFIPNRLEVSKQHIRDFIKLRGGDRLGTIMFAEKIITLSPLTFDQESVLSMVDEINVGFLGNGTNIGDAVGLASKRLSESDVKTKIIILLTDGVSNVGNLNPIQAAKFSEELGIKIYSIGIGTDNKAKLPYKVSGKTFYQEIPGGSIDIETLKKMSTKTGGAFYYAKSSTSLKNVFNSIDKLEKTKISTSEKKDFVYMYETPL